MKKKLCFMCRKRPARRLAAERDKQVYVNATTERIFCSQRCAANYALLWGATVIEAGHHFCPASGAWEPVEREGCLECNPRRQ